MNSRAVVVLLGLCTLLLAGLLLRLTPGPAAAQTPAASETGRYSLVCTGNSQYFLDTRTGQIWTYVSLEVGRDKIIQDVKPHWVQTDSPVSHPQPVR